jgi:hypothetical protein
MQQPSWRFGFHDLHSFKDFVGFVKRCAPDDFPVREWRGASDQWSLDRAYEGLRTGLEMAASQGVGDTTLEECRSLFDAAFDHYRAGNRDEGSKSMGAAERILRQLPSAEGAGTSCWSWFVLAQAPAALGIVYFAAMLTGHAEPGYMALGYLFAWCATVGGTFVSLVASLCFGKSRCGGVGCLLAIAYALYLAILLGLGALFMFAPRESTPRPGGGY